MTKPACFSDTCAPPTVKPFMIPEKKDDGILVIPNQKEKKDDGILVIPNQKEKKDDGTLVIPNQKKEKKEEDTGIYFDDSNSSESIELEDEYFELEGF